MKILHYIPSIDESSGGVGAFMQLLARDLGALCELHVVTHRSSSERLLENCHLHYIDYKWKPWNNSKKAFLNLLGSLRPDVFHTNCCWMPLSALTAMWAHDAGYKVVYTPHGMLEPYSIARHYWTKKLPAILLFQKKGIKVCDLIHSTAETERDNLLRLDWNDRICMIPNCVQIEGIEIKQSWKRNKKILFLSRVHPKKGVNFLIEAVAQLRNDLEGYTITIAGPGDDAYIKELMALAKRYDVVDMFDFIGAVCDKDKWALYREADLFVLPTWSENFGIVVPEALSCGTPVITTEGTPWAELNDMRCGWCTAVGTGPIRDAIAKFLACYEQELEGMGRRGRQLVEQKYTSEAVARQFVNMYKTLMEKRYE